MKVPITVEAPEGTSAVALEYHVPKGWKVTGISDGGEWDEHHRKIKWGPFFENLSRTVIFKASRLAGAGRAADFFGIVSFDGVNRPVTAP